MLTDGSIFGVVEDRYCLSTRAQSAVGLVGGGVCGEQVSNSARRVKETIICKKGWNEILIFFWNEEERKKDVQVTRNS